MTTSSMPQRFQRQLQSEVLGIIRRQGAATRSELEQHTGVGRAVVAFIVDQLIEAGHLVDRAPAHHGGRGRPSRLLAPVYPEGLVIGIDIGHDHVAASLAEVDLTVIAERRTALQVDSDSAAALNVAAELVTEILDESERERVAVRACVAGLPGPLDITRRSVASPTILSSWAGLDVAEEMNLRTGLIVSVDNDANLGAIAEQQLGAAAPFDDFIYIKASGGVGAGVVIAGRLVQGTFGAAGEIGHTQLTSSGNWCRCGNRGCLETLVSVEQILQQIRHLYPPHFPMREHLSEIAQHPVARKVFGESGRTLGVVVANLCALLDPAAVIVGGELGQASPEFVDGVRESITRLAQPGFDERVTVVPAGLGVRAEIVGCLLAARDIAISG